MNNASTKEIPINISARHLHLTSGHIEILFGKGTQLTKLKPLSQPGQFAANETVEVHGPKSSFKHVRILGPARSATQLEISLSDARAIGVKAPVRESGQIAGTPGIRLIGPAGEVTIQEGVIVAARHIHFHTEDAKRWNIQDKQLLQVQVKGERHLIFGNVLARVSDNFALDMHIDTDEGNAAGVVPGMKGTVID